MAGGRRRRWPGGGGGGARSACPVLAAVARRPGALGSPRAVAPRRMTRGRRVLQQWPGSYVSERRPVACAHLVRARAVRACRAIDVRGRPAHVCPSVLCPRCARAVLSSYLDGEIARTTPPTAPAFSPARAVMLVPAPYVHVQCLLLPLLHPVRTPAMRRWRRFALCGLSCSGCAMCVPVRAGAVCLCRGFTVPSPTSSLPSRRTTGRRTTRLRKRLVAAVNTASESLVAIVCVDPLCYSRSPTPACAGPSTSQSLSSLPFAMGR